MRLAGISAALLAAGVTGATAPDTSLKAVLTASTTYLADYQQQLRFLVADEQTTQRVLDAGGRDAGRRRTRGEFFVTFVPDDRMWMSVHDIEEVDGRAVPDRQDLRQMLTSGSLAGAARTLIQRNAQFNLGRIVRNFNEPTIALVVLEPRRRAQFRFSRKRIERSGDADLVTLAFKETERPTLVRSTEGRDVPSTGELTVEAGTGRIRRTFIQFTDGPTRAQLTTIYGLEQKLGIWVPVAFSERYERTKGDRELILCETDYTNYRRFDVSVRIK